MKMRLFFIMLCVFSLQYAAHAACLTIDEAKDAVNASNPCYCRTGAMGTTHTCESGWKYNSGVCTHDNVSGRDLKGYYNITYGENDTCEPTQSSSYVCYEVRENGGTGCTCLNSNEVESGTVPNGVEPAAP